MLLSCFRATPNGHARPPFQDSQLLGVPTLNPKGPPKEKDAVANIVRTPEEFQRYSRVVHKAHRRYDNAVLSTCCTYGAGSSACQLRRSDTCQQFLCIQVFRGRAQAASRQHSHAQYQTFNTERSAGAEFKVVMVTSMRGAEETTNTISSLNVPVDVIWADAPLSEPWKGLAWRGFSTKIHSLLPYLRSQTPEQLVM